MKIIWMKNTYRIFLLILGLLLCQNVKCQNYTIVGKIKGLQSKQVYLYDYYGEKNTLIDSTQADDENEFQFILKSNTLVGLYKIGYSNDKSLDIIFNNENIRFSTNNSYPIDSMNIIQSVENKLYYEYINKRDKSHYKLGILNQLLNSYPEKDSFYFSVQKEFLLIQQNLDAYAQSIIDKQPLSYISKIARIERSPLVIPDMPPLVRNEYMRSHFLDNSFDDTLLIRSNVITSKIITYLTFYRNQQFSKERQESEYIIGIDTVLQKIRTNETIYEFVVDYLIRGFEKYGYDRLITHVAFNSRFDEGCVNTERKQQLEKKIENLKRLSVGKIAPDINVTCYDGKNVKLSDISTDYTVLLFWASWCPHCSQLIPELKNVYNKHKNKLEFIAISIDTDKKAYEDFLSKNQIDWINCTDLMGWESKTVKDFDVFATPTMFLLDKNKKILSKPITINQLKDALTEIGLN